MRTLGFSLALLIAAGMVAFAKDGFSGDARIIQASAANCPQGNYYRDGCLGAHAGTPQNPHLLDAYGPLRPPWNVAGVDYPTGYTGTLSDPATSLPACAEYVPIGSPPLLTVNVISTPCYLDHLDFSLHGSTCLQTDPSLPGGGTLTVTNSYFRAGPNECPNGVGLITMRGPANLVAFYNTFDGADADGTYDSYLGYAVFTPFAGTGNQTFEFNSFLHCPQACLTFTQTGNINIQYNYVQGIDVGGNHGNWFVFNNFTMTQITETLNASFDTVYLDSTSGANMTALCYITFAGLPYPPAVFSGGCKNETYIARAGHNVGGTAIRVYPVGTAQGPLTIANNYIDPTDFASSSQIISSSNADGTSNSVTCKGNINMLDGTTIPVTLYPGTTQFFTCN